MKNSSQRCQGSTCLIFQGGNIPKNQISAERRDQTNGRNWDQGVPQRLGSSYLMSIAAWLLGRLAEAQ